MAELITKVYSFLEKNNHSGQQKFSDVFYMYRIQRPFLIILLSQGYILKES